MITDFDTDNFRGGENNFDTLEFTFGGVAQELSTGEDIVDFAELLNTDGNADTGSFNDGDDLIFVFARDPFGEVLDSIRLEDVIGDDGITDNSLGDAFVTELDDDLLLV